MTCLLYLSCHQRFLGSRQVHTRLDVQLERRRQAGRQARTQSRKLSVFTCQRSELGGVAVGTNISVECSVDAAFSMAAQDSSITPCCVYLWLDNNRFILQYLHDFCHCTLLHCNKTYGFVNSFVFPHSFSVQKWSSALKQHTQVS